MHDTNQTAAKAAAKYRFALLIDDDPISLELSKASLLALGLEQVITAADGVAALRLLDRMVQRPDLVVCDLYMPEMDGIEFINALGQRQYGGAIILITAGDLGILQIATKMARHAHGLSLLGAFPKPLDAADVARVLGLETPPALPQ